MRNLLFIALLAAFSLTACNRSGDAAPGADPTASASKKAQAAITGTLNAANGAPAVLPEGAVVTVRLLDGTRSDAPPTEVLAVPVASTGSLPMSYSLPYDPKSIDRIATYLVDANVTLNGQLLFLTQARLPVLTQGAGSTKDIPLIQGLALTAPVTEADEAKRLFADLQAQLGAMKRLVGDRIVGETTIGWDAFSDSTSVRMVRENVVYGEGGDKATLRFAYRDGKPWVATKEQGGSKTMIAWDKFGNVVLREVERGGSTSEASEDVAAELKRGSEAALEIVAAKL